MDCLDDASTGGRVTRSLRKRLTSVDSNDAGSRPTTPQLTKLTSIPESSSPSRSLRMTRRNSITGNGTPLKAMSKSKTSTITETPDTVNSPAKRTTRRISISALNTPNNSNQEDDDKIVSKEMPARRVTRLQSKSPPQPEVDKKIAHVSPKKNKSGPKSRRNKLPNDESDSDVEVINLEESNEEESNNITPKVEKMTEKTPTKLQVVLKSIKNLNENIEIIDLSDETLVIDDGEKTENVNIHKEEMNPIETEETKVESMHPEPLCKTTNEMGNLNTSSRTDSIKKSNNKEILSTSEDKLHTQDNNDLNVSKILRSPEKHVNNNLTSKMEGKAEETSTRVSSQVKSIESMDLSKGLLEKDSKAIIKNMDLQTDKISSTKPVEPTKPKENEENNVESVHPDPMCSMSNVTDDVQTSPHSPLTDSAKNEVMLGRNVDTLHLEFSEDDEELKGDNIVRTPKKLPSPSNISNSSPVESVLSNNFSSKAEDKREETSTRLSPGIQAIETPHLSDDKKTTMAKNKGVKMETFNSENNITYNIRSEDSVKPSEKEENNAESLEAKRELKSSQSDTPITNSIHLSVNDDELKLGTNVRSPEEFSSPPKNKTNASLVESVIMLQKLSPKVIARLCTENNILSQKNSKSVTFQNNNLDNDDLVKSSYPKTPASIKSKAFISKDRSKSDKDNSNSSNNSSFVSFRNASDHVEESEGHQESESNVSQDKESVITNDPIGDHFGDEVEMRQDTPIKHKNPTMLQSSTPVCDFILPSKSELETNAVNNIDNAEKSEKKCTKKSEDINNANNNKRTELTTAINADESIKTTPSYLQQQQKEINVISTVIDNISTHSVDDKNKKENDEQFSKSWTHNVSGCATSVRKIDIITENSSISKQHQDSECGDIKLVVNEKILPKASKINSSDLESEMSNNSIEKLEFIDDEANEEPDDYQSGDSMDDEERKEMEVNEVIEDGESIGSEDTLSDRSNDGDEEDIASFVTSDSDESLLEYSDEDEHIEDDSKKCKNLKRNSRILVTSESEEDEQHSNRNKKKLTNGITNKEENKLSNRRTCILASSESETEEEPSTKFEEENESAANTSKVLEKPLNFDVTKMIDASSDDEMNINETLPQEQNVNPKINSNKDDECGCTNDANDKRVGYEFESENENSSMNQCNATTTCTVELGATNGNGFKLSNPSPNKKRPQSLLDSMSPIQNTGCGDKAEIEMDINGENCNSDGSPVTEDWKDTYKTQQKTLETLNSSNESIIAKDAPTVNDIDKNKKKFQDVYEFQECENSVPQSGNESTATNTDDEEGDIEIPETQKVERVADVFHNKSTFDEESSEDIDEIVNGSSNLKNVGLSESFCQAKFKRIDFKSKKSPRHRSFTVGVSGMKNDNDGRTEQFEPSHFLGAESNDSSQNNSINFENSNEVQLERGEVEKLEMLKYSNLRFPNVKRKRQSLSVYDVNNMEKNTCLKKSKRKSVQSSTKEKFNPSKSLIESIESRKRELDTIKGTKLRLSKSFCETLKHVSKGLAEGNTSSSSDESDDKDVKNTSTTRNRNTLKNSKKDYISILERCDEILEAANHAKLEAKQNLRKSKVIVPKSKKSSKQSASPEEESGNRESLVTKDVKHLKDKSTAALEQALRASAKILMDEDVKNKKMKSPLQITEEQFFDKRLPTQILDSLSDEDSKSKPEKKKFNKHRHSLIQRMNCASGEVIEETLTPKKKKRDILKKIELPTGIVLEEPVTPTKKTNKNSFRESPVTPRNIGFKVRHILTAGQDEVPELRGASHNAERKHKRKMIDPEHVLPKPQWSQSGVFLEEMLPSFNDKKRFKFHGTSACGSVNSSSALNALNFKHSSIFRKNIPRESSHEVLQRKERQCISRKRF